MKKMLIFSCALLLLSSSITWASEPDSSQTFSILNNVDAVSLLDDEMASTHGKHLTITNGTNSWEHPVSAFHGTLTITPRGGANLVITEFLKP